MFRNLLHRLAALILLFLPLGEISASEPASVEIAIASYAFGPDSITVAPGTTVTWVNRDDVPHNVVAADGSFRSAALDTGESFSITFQAAGSFTYFCALHPHMTGQVVVQPSP